MRGGPRKGAGRPPGSVQYPGLKPRTIRLTDTEYTAVKQYIKEMRGAKKDEN